MPFKRDRTCVHTYQCHPFFFSFSITNTHAPKRLSMTDKMTLSCAPRNDEIRHLRNDCGGAYGEESKLHEFDDSSTGLAAVALVELAKKSPSDGEMQSIKGRKQSVMPSTFLTKLMDMLNRSEYSRVLSWTTDGQSISVNNSREAVEPILRLHFTLKYDVFIRKLRQRGFAKIGTGINYDFFYNKSFQRGEPMLNKIGRLNEMVFPDFNANASSVELNLESTSDNESVSSNFHNNNVKLLQPNNPNLDVTHIQEDSIQYLNEIPTIPLNYLSRRLNNSSQHKKIIGDAWQYLLNENARQNDCNVEMQSDLAHEYAIGTLDMNTTLSAFEGYR